MRPRVKVTADHEVGSIVAFPKDVVEEVREVFVGVVAGVIATVDS